MKAKMIFVCFLAITLFSTSLAWAAYHHEGEKDAAKFLEAYPDKAGTKLDHCVLCHSGGQYLKYESMVTLGSCQWCHREYGYDAAGGTAGLASTLNPYGNAYKAAGKTAAAITTIDNDDSDGDGYTNREEILANSFPGDASDDASMKPAPLRIYTKKQLEAMTQHTQFMLMNTSRSGDFYAEYTGVPLKDLLDDAGIDLSQATGIMVYAPDGWSQYHPLEYDATMDMYHVYGNETGQSYQYPPASYYYSAEADEALNTDSGWCDYSAPSTVGRNHGDPIPVTNGLKAILAIQRDGAYLDPGVLNDENKLDGSGPFRVVVPQKYPNAPDQSSKSDQQDVEWPYVNAWDHSAGSCSRSATIIKVEPLPAGTTDINIYEAGWSYVDGKKVIIYGAIDGTDSNGNGILDSEEKVDAAGDFDGDGTPDYMDQDTANFKHTNGNQAILMNTPKGKFTGVESLSDTDVSLSQTNKPTATFPYGATKFTVEDLTPGDSVTITQVLPEAVPTTAKYYKITSAGWKEIPFGSNDGDNTITITLTDGDADTDADGVANGIILDPGVLALVESTTPDDDGDDGDDGDTTTTGGSSPSGNDDDDGACFVSTLENGSFTNLKGMLLLVLLGWPVLVAIKKIKP
ncbi:MAG: hypothetical protein GY866_06890 [Proteobacteria bacterium]|nr:hypothetical protein [Pseudomonadota bacterium]